MGFPYGYPANGLIFDLSVTVKQPFSSLNIILIYRLFLVDKKPVVNTQYALFFVNLQTLIDYC